MRFHHQPPHMFMPPQSHPCLLSHQPHHQQRPHPRHHPLPCLRNHTQSRDQFLPCLLQELQRFPVGLALMVMTINILNLGMFFPSTLPSTSTTRRTVWRSRTTFGTFAAAADHTRTRRPSSLASAAISPRVDLVTPTMAAGSATTRPTIATTTISSFNKSYINE